MPRTLSLRLVSTFVCLAAGCAASGAMAAGPTHILSSQYRLQGAHAAPTLRELEAARAEKVSRSASSSEYVANARLQARPFAKLIDNAARETALDPALVHAVISIESGYNPAARSPKGAFGLMQVMPDTALRYGVKNVAHSPSANIRAGTRYIQDLMTMFDRRLDLVLAAYNAGEGAVLKYGERIPPYRETQQYVPAVLARYRAWREPAALPPLETIVAATPGRVRVQYMAGTLLDTDSLHAAGFR